MYFAPSIVLPVGLVTHSHHYNPFKSKKLYGGKDSFGLIPNFDDAACVLAPEIGSKS